jgi:hypothetical protein
LGGLVKRGLVSQRVMDWFLSPGREREQLLRDLSDEERREFDDHCRAAVRLLVLAARKKQRR